MSQIDIPPAGKRNPVGKGIGAMLRRRLLEKVHLLSACGAGVEAIAPSLCSALRDLIGADSGSLFWLDAQGFPSGFFHDSAPAEIKDIFVTRFEELFSAPSEPNMVSYLMATGASIGTALAQDQKERLWASNVFRYLCEPLGHWHLIDMRCDVGGSGRILFCGWNQKNRPFLPSHITALQPAQALIEQNIGYVRDDVGWHSLGSRTAHFITDMSGTQLLAIDADAEKMLMAGHLLRQNVPMATQMGQPPTFAKQLAEMLLVDSHPTISIAVPDGRIVASAVATQMRNAGAEHQAQMFVSLDLEICRDTLIIDHISALPLTLLQKEIMLFGMRGGERGECEGKFGVSAEALKKHVRAIYDAAQVSRWPDLTEINIAADWPRW